MAGTELKNDCEIVLAAVTQNGIALLHASEELKNDREVVLAAVTQNGFGQVPRTAVECAKRWLTSSHRR